MDVIAGIDLGSRTTKVVLLDSQRRWLASASTRTRADFVGTASEVLTQALEAAGASEDDVVYLATTGLGRTALPNRDIQITDITCVAKGAKHLFPGTGCVLDIGAQSTRAIRIRDAGKVAEFKTNDKCAAGAGGFLERACKYLEVTVDALGTLSLEAKNPTSISSVCAVLAESEIINHISSGQSVPDILRGIHDSLASRAMGLLSRVGLGGELTFVGGVAQQAGAVAALKAVAGVPVNVPEKPVFVAALGAALLGLTRHERRQSGADAPKAVATA